jgi:hypothetical protein
MGLGHHKIARHCRRIAQLHINARLYNNFNYLTHTEEGDWLYKRLWRGQTFMSVMHQIEVDYCSVDMLEWALKAANARDPTLLTWAYESAIYDGFKNLLFDYGKTKFSIPKL